MPVSDDEELVLDGLVEEVDGVVVLSSDSAADVQPGRTVLPAMAQAAAVAATGFAAGAVAAAVVRAVRSKGAIRPRRPQAQIGPQIVATRSYRIDVHVLAQPD